MESGGAVTYGTGDDIESCLTAAMKAGVAYGAGEACSSFSISAEVEAAMKEFQANVNAVLQAITGQARTQAELSFSLLTEEQQAQIVADLPTEEEAIEMRATLTSTRSATVIERGTSMEEVISTGNLSEITFDAQPPGWWETFTNAAYSAFWETIGTSTGQYAAGAVILVGGAGAGVSITYLIEYLTTANKDSNIPLVRRVSYPLNYTMMNSNGVILFATSATGYHDVIGSDPTGIKRAEAMVRARMNAKIAIYDKLIQYYLSQYYTTSNRILRLNPFTAGSITLSTKSQIITPTGIKTVTNKLSASNQSNNYRGRILLNQKLTGQKLYTFLTRVSAVAIQSKIRSAANALTLSSMENPQMKNTSKYTSIDGTYTGTASSTVLTDSNDTTTPYPIVLALGRARLLSCAALIVQATGD